MFAFFFGLGLPEIIVLVVIGLLMLAIPAAVILRVLAVVRRPRNDSQAHEHRELRAEVKDLREEVERLKRGLPRAAPDPGNATGIRASD
jgi:cell division protein FtsB